MSGFQQVTPVMLEEATCFWRAYFDEIIQSSIHSYSYYNDL